MKTKQVPAVPRDCNVIDTRHETMVAAGGGKYVGFSMGLILFNSPKTGSTLALPADQLTAEAVKKHIEESNAKFKVVS